jgi:putative membrane protein
LEANGLNGRRYRRHVAVLATVYLVIWSLLAIAPYDRGDWALENVLVLLFVGALVAVRRQFRFSRTSCTLIFLFLCLHAVGSHYTYAKVPYDDWWRALTGGTFNEMVGWQRNHFDRLVHFCYGLLLAYPIREVFLRVVQVRGFWAYFLPLDFTLSTSALFELFEWLAAEFFGGDLGVAYLGTQGDVWDAHKDMALAAIGALLAMLLAAWFNYHRRRDFAREWSDRFKQPA